MVALLGLNRRSGGLNCSGSLFYYLHIAEVHSVLVTFLTFYYEATLTFVLLNRSFVVLHVQKSFSELLKSHGNFSRFIAHGTGPPFDDV